MKRRDFSLMLAAAAAGQLAYAQASFPTKPIRLIVPFAVGGGIDLLARMFAQALSEQLGQQMVVENQGGGGGSIAAATVARAPADGYTLLFQTSGSAVSAAAMQKLPFDPVKDFAPVTLAARFPLVLLVNPDVPAQNLPEFLQLLRREPGKYSYGSAGTGSGTHLAAEWFKKLGKVDMLHIPYKGTSAVMPDLLSGRVHALFDGLPPQLSNITSGRLRPLGVTTATRSPFLPGVPALAEALPGYDLPFWTGISAPAKTPQAVVDKLASATAKVVESPQFAARLKEYGAQGVGSTSSQYQKFWLDQIALYTTVLKDTGIRLEGN
ncbi:tripartite tricarboxylate transporter substrate binding protein [Polaromonas sp. P1(28)-8]|nr:tripartite tricarboxylate transporter substrate binding protein [Polaromonas sp. P1(28)-8]